MSKRHVAELIISLIKEKPDAAAKFKSNTL